MKSIFVLLVLLFSFVTPPALAEQRALDETLIYYTYFGTPFDVERILDRGANPNAKDKHDWTALAIAANRKDGKALEISKLLLDKGADPNIEQTHGQYPLATAVMAGNAPLVQYLIHKGANTHVKSPNGNNLEEAARIRGYDDIAEYISKMFFEEDQYAQYLASDTHRQQLVEKIALKNCAAQYWDFYVRSEQDRNLNKKDYQKVIVDLVYASQSDATDLLKYFPTMEKSVQGIVAKSRANIVTEMNGLVSNRNRKRQGVGTQDDLYKRCSNIARQIRMSSVAVEKEKK
jgi:virulence-associated protein VapD